MISKERVFQKIDYKLAIGLIIVLTIFAYANSLMNSFVWDDYLVIVHNDFVKSWSNFPLIFNRSYLTSISDIDYLGIRDIGSGEFSYRPIVTMSYFVDYSIWKLNPLGYHLTNVLLHICNVVLLCLFINLLVKDRVIALLTSLFFALHPANAEAVSVIAFREDLLTFFFYMVAFIFFILTDKCKQGKRLGCYLVSCGFFLLALFSKEMAVTFPALLVLYDYIVDRTKDKPAVLERLKSRYLGYIAILLFYLFIRFVLMESLGRDLLQYAIPGLYVRILTMFKVFATYFQWMLLPINVHPTLPGDPSLISHSLFDLRVLLSILFVVSMFGIAIKLRTKSPLYSFAILWIFFTLAPVSNIFFPLTNYMAGRYLYLPIIGFCLLVVTFLHELPSRKSLPISQGLLRILARDAVIVIVAAYLVYTPLTNIGFKNNILFWQDMCERYPNSALAHSNLGANFREVGLLDKAIKEYKKALSLDPHFARDYNALGVCYYEKGALDVAIRKFEMATKTDPELTEAYVNLGRAFGEKGLYKKAIDCFELALEIEPRSDVYNNIGVTYARMQK